MKECLKMSAADASITENRLQVLEAIEKDFLFDGFKEFFSNLVPTDEHFPYVCAHNDSQENNVLVKEVGGKLELILIDVEYAGWNPMAFDLANYFCETMLENASKTSETGIACYLDNMMTLEEVNRMAKIYLITYFTKFMPVDK